ncbi:hypothetical protein [Aliikangiella sp. G2MR2-5]|uniref:hypothetical protein n=1 Tax=Aliikangiella sp. G2MR2-5 TaxID=2788943 RepID=UPI0018AC2F8D|nr:hypothetical protein [Aliikangiella sp. G2MR2-5]
MGPTKGQFWLVIIAVMALLGQITAANALSCQLGSVVNDDVPEAAVNHSGHSMGAAINMPSDNLELQALTQMTDCCDDDSGCKMSSCVTMGLSQSLQSLNLVLPSSIISFEMLLDSGQEFSSLYRPPIFA